MGILTSVLLVVLVLLSSCNLGRAQGAAPARADLDRWRATGW